jgi:hypothetical protein
VKRIADTSVASFESLKPDVATREAHVIDGLRRYRIVNGFDPTAYELLRFLQLESPRLDLNAVRPRLTELEDATRVTKRDKRRCSVTGKHVYTWAVASPSPRPAPDVAQPRYVPPVQTELFR